ncbi:MAG TPA: phasin family protein [Bradyrhizobium sp.]|jgi:Phasin protein|nr:phasin family protein [Bradyrhizobium sp.]
MPTEQSNREDFNRAAKSAQKQIGDTEKRIGDAALEAQNQFLKTLEEMSREAMACATAEVERGLKLSKKLSAAQSVSDAVAAYQEWLSEEMNARSEDARRFMSTGQSFMTTSQKALSNGWSGLGMST